MGGPLTAKVQGYLNLAMGGLLASSPVIGLPSIRHATPWCWVLAAGVASRLLPTHGEVAMPCCFSVGPAGSAGRCNVQGGLHGHPSAGRMFVTCMAGTTRASGPLCSLQVPSCWLLLLV